MSNDIFSMGVNMEVIKKRSGKRSDRIGGIKMLKVRKLK